MTGMSRGGRGRIVIAIVALTLLVSATGIGVWLAPRGESTAALTDPHAGHLSAQVNGAGDGMAGAIAVIPPASESAGNSPQTSLGAAAGQSVEAPLAAAAGSAPLGGEDPNAGGTVSLQAPGEAASPAADSSLRNGAAGLGKGRPDTLPSDVFRQGVAPGGCDPAYGTAGQCLPIVPPSHGKHLEAMVRAGVDPRSMNYPWTCPELRRYFPDGITVRVPGVDPDRLDRDGDGLACEPS